MRPFFRKTVGRSWFPGYPTGPPVTFGPWQSVARVGVIDGMVISNATPISTLNPAVPPVVGETEEWPSPPRLNHSACYSSTTIPGTPG